MSISRDSTKSTLMLLKEAVSFIEVRKTFETVLHDYPPELGSYLATDAPIVVDQIFEGALAKLANGYPLTEAERESVSCLLKPVSHDEDDFDAAAVNLDGDELSSYGWVQYQSDSRSRLSSHSHTKIVQHFNTATL